MSLLASSTPPPLTSIDSDCSSTSSSPQTPTGLHYDPDMASPIGTDFSGFSFRQRPAIPQKSAFRKSCPPTTWPGPFKSDSLDGCALALDVTDVSYPPSLKIRQISVTERPASPSIYPPGSFSRRVSTASLTGASGNNTTGPAAMSRSVSWLAQRRGSTMSFEMRRESLAEKRTSLAQLGAVSVPVDSRRLSCTFGSSTTPSVSATQPNTREEALMSYWSTSEEEGGETSSEQSTSSPRHAEMEDSPAWPINSTETHFTTVRRISRVSAASSTASPTEEPLSPFTRARRVSVEQARRMSRQRSCSLSSDSEMPSPAEAKTPLRVARVQAQSAALQAQEAQFACVMADLSAAHLADRASFKAERDGMAAEVTLLRRRLAVLERQNEMLNRAHHA